MFSDWVWKYVTTRAGMAASDAGRPALVTR